VRHLFSFIAAGALLALLLVAYQFTKEPEPPRRQGLPPSETGAVRSDKLQQTVIVPTLDSPVPANKSVIWCASFQLAWNRFKSDVTKGPVQLKNAEEVADRLNRAEQSEDDLDPATYYAAAGLVRDGIVARIRQEMAAKFPDAPLPQVGEAGTAALAYAFLQAGVRYKYEYYDNTNPFHFTGSDGKKVAVHSFGIRPSERAQGHRTFRAQVQILFQDPVEFALDLCRDSQPNQVILAAVGWKGTLAATLAHVQKPRTKPPSERSGPEFGQFATLLVPNMDWDLEHHFRELEGPDKLFLNPTLRGLYLDTALQRVRFRLDRRGAEVRSEAQVVLKGLSDGRDDFHFDRPFLVVMTKRGARQPFFVMWVDSAEMLSRW
jgi:hypothetical protein